ncbi:ATP-grasp domain-containing protein [Bacillus cereus]|nr:ATP-grasp domain-containing protein [Bacillus cereus]
MDFIYFSKKPFGWAEQMLVEKIRELGYTADVYDWDEVEITDSSFMYQGKEMKLPTVAMFISRVRTRHIQGDRLYLFDWLELLETKGVRILNRPKAVRSSSNKVYAANILKSAGIRVPETRLVTSMDQIETALKEWKDIILKPLAGNASVDLTRLILDERRYGDEETEVLSIFQETPIWNMLQKHPVICAQQYVQNPGHDIRINVVAGKVVSISANDALPNTWRKKDINEGKLLRKYELTKELESIALKAVEVLGLDYAPIDLVEGEDGPVVIEVNSAISIWPGHETMGITIDSEGSVKYYVNMIIENINKYSTQSV